eukprot:5644734-Pyramimonas_sp.AAC.1
MSLTWYSVTRDSGSRNSNQQTSRREVSEVDWRLEHPGPLFMWMTGDPSMLTCPHSPEWSERPSIAAPRCLLSSSSHSACGSGHIAQGGVRGPASTRAPLRSRPGWPTSPGVNGDEIAAIAPKPGGLRGRRASR